MEELFSVLEEKQDVNFNEIVSEVSKLIVNGRELNYYVGEIGITTLIDCPRKHRLKEVFGYPKIENNLIIEEGFLFEKVFKAALKKKYGDRFKDELELPYELDGVKIRGHLDCFVEFEDKVIGIELKHTLVEVAPHIKSEPPKIIVLNPKDPEISINPKYVKQARIQKYLLKKIFPEKEVKHYLFIKTTLKGAYRYFKSYLLYEIIDDMADEEFKELIKRFRCGKKTENPVDCFFCHFKRSGMCDGVEKPHEIKMHVPQKLQELVNKREKLLKELEAIEEAIKKELKGDTYEINGKIYGKVEYTGFSYNLPMLVKLIKESGYSPVDFLQVKPSKIRDLEDILGAKIELARTPVKKEQRVLGKPVEKTQN